MTTVSFEIESSKIKAIQSALKALGIEKIRIEDNSAQTLSEEIINKLEKAHIEYINGNTQRIDPKKIWESI
jgi:precorrin-6B methylase 2